MMKVLDFSSDNDDSPDSRGSFTHASLERPGLPRSFTLCTAFMVEAWTGEGASAMLFMLRGDDGLIWIHVDLYAADLNTKFTVNVGDTEFEATNTTSQMFPLQWIHACLSLDADSTLRLVVDGQLLEERSLGEVDRPQDTSLVLGWATTAFTPPFEYTGMTTGLVI